MKTHLYHLHAVSPLHVGVGQAVGVVDLPIMREKTTHLPMVPGSALKGVLRDEFANSSDQDALFGPKSISGEAKGFAGALAFGDAWLLCMPVRSLVGIAAFATSPFLLARYRAAAERVGVHDLPELPQVSADGAVVTENCTLLHNDQMLVLEDLDVPAVKQPALSAWAKKLCERVVDGPFAEHFEQRFVVVDDEVFGFLADTGTEVRARIAIDDARGVVRDGALWYEENLPAESILFGVLAFDELRNGAEPVHSQFTREKFLNHLGAAQGGRAERLIQIGGKATVGRGLVRFIV